MKLTIETQCADDKEQVITLTDENGLSGDHVMLNGDTLEVILIEGMVISGRERSKTPDWVKWLIDERDRLNDVWSRRPYPDEMLAYGPSLRKHRDVINDIIGKFKDGQS